MGQWLTPNETPASIEPFVIYLPVGWEYRALFRGALLLLTMAENWEKWGELEPLDVAVIWQTVYELFQFEELP